MACSAGAWEGGSAADQCREALGSVRSDTPGLAKLSPTVPHSTSPCPRPTVTFGISQNATVWPGQTSGMAPSSIMGGEAGKPAWCSLELNTLRLTGPVLDFQGEAASRVQDPGPELSPEERRVLERKLKKERKKEEKKRLREAGVAAAQTPPARRSGAELALDYLCG